MLDPHLALRARLAPAPSADGPTCAQAWELWLARLAPATRATYASALGALARASGADGPQTAAEALCAAGPARATAALEAWTAQMGTVDGLCQPSIRVRLAAVLSWLRVARRFGLIDWPPDPPRLTAEARKAYRETAGPGAPAVYRLAAATGTVEGKLLVRLLYSLALRRGEALALTVGDWHPERRALTIHGKGRRDPEEVPVPAGVAALLTARCDEVGAGRLFPRWRASGVNGWLARLARKAGLPHVRPHGLRHSAITRAIEGEAAAGRPVIGASGFSRHRDSRVLLRYYDNSQDRPRAISEELDAPFHNGGEQ